MLLANGKPTRDRYASIARECSSFGGRKLRRTCDTTDGRVWTCALSVLRIFEHPVITELSS